jgi:hypothetical protein
MHVNMTTAGLFSSLQATLHYYIMLFQGIPLATRTGACTGMLMAMDEAILIFSALLLGITQRNWNKIGHNCILPRMRSGAQCVTCCIRSEISTEILIGCHKRLEALPRVHNWQLCSIPHSILLLGNRMHAGQRGSRVCWPRVHLPCTQQPTC